jgi:predicted aspartyl protease
MEQRFTTQGKVIVRGGCNNLGHPIINITIKNTPLVALIDTGASYSFLEIEKARLMNLIPTGEFVKFKRSMNAASNQTVPLYHTPFSFMGIKIEKAEMCVAPTGGLDAVLGIPFLGAFNDFRFFPKERKWELTLLNWTPPASEPQNYLSTYGRNHNPN